MSQVGMIVGRVLDLLPDALTLANAPALVVEGVRKVLVVAKPILARLVDESLAAEPLPPLPDVRPPSMGGAVREGLSELGILGVSPVAQSEPPPPDTDPMPPLVG